MAHDIPPLSLDAYRLVFEANPHPVLLFETGTWRILAANDAAARLYGWTADELASMTLLDIRPDDDRERFIAFASAISEGIHHIGHVVHRARD
jgi:PAS domain S-box-containing protein